MLAAHAGISDQDLLEKDVRLHLLLDALTSDPHVGRDLIFKGGTCLIKCYLDYPRFSTDLDFTWRPVDGWGDVGTKGLRRILRPLQRNLVERLVGHANIQGLAFDPEKDVQYGQSNRMMTALMRYETVFRLPGMIKLQVNFAEPLLFPTRSKEARGLLGTDLPEAMRLLDSGLPSRYTRLIPVEAYDPREILAEKGRAILTRQAAKTRDLVDLHLLESTLGLRIEDYEDAIETKIWTAVERTARYRRHLGLWEDRFDLLKEEDVGPLLLKPLDKQAFQSYRERVLSVLAKISNRCLGDD